MKTKRIITIFTACSLACTAAFSVHAAEPKDHTTQKALAVSYENPELAEYAEQVALLVNNERTANGLQAVKLSPQLSEAANIRSGELNENFSHTRPDGTSCFTAMDELGITYRAAAENIAYGQNSPESVMNAWMNSSGHRANILNKNMEYIGVGVVYRDGIYYWTQLFASSDSLSDGAYLPGEDDEKPVTTSSTTAAPVTTTQTTTTAVSATSEQTTATEPIITTTSAASTSAVQTTTEQITTVSTSVTTNTTACQPSVTEQTSTTYKTDRNDCVIVVTKPVIFGDCSAVIGGTIEVISPK